MHRFAPTLTACLLLGSCASSSELPAVRDAERRPANQAHELERLSCRHALHNLQIQAGEQRLLLDSTYGTLQRCMQAAASHSNAASASSRTPPPAANQVFQIHFDFGRSEPKLSRDAARALADAVRAAPLIVLKGRTDGSTFNTTDARLAQARAVAVRDLLVASGVDARHVRTTYQPTGDHWVDNEDPTLSHLNRRVEVEAYPTLPVTSALLGD